MDDVQKMIERSQKKLNMKRTNPDYFSGIIKLKFRRKKVLAMSVSDNFKSFCSNLRMSDTVVSNIQYRTKRITKQLNKDFWNSDSETNNSFYSGSYGRGTDIFVSDIDLMMVLPYSTYKQFNSYQSNGQSALLQAVKNSIENTYHSYKSGDGQVVKVDFTDGISYEVVPCFLNGDSQTYTYPDTNNGGRWRVANPKAEISAINQMNNDTNKNLKRLCRMARAWKNKNNVSGMNGYLIDTLAYKFIKDWEYKDKSYIYYDWMIRDYLKYLKETSNDQWTWYAPGSNQAVVKKGNFTLKASIAYNHTLSAIEADGKNHEYTAKSEWREVFGTKYC